MKLLILSIISLLTLLSPPAQQTTTQCFTLNDHIISLSPELDGVIEWIQWDRQEVKVVTTLTSNLSTPDGLDYLMRENIFELLAHSGANNTLILRSKKMNTQVFVKGQLLRMQRHYKIYVPSYLLLE